MGFDMYYTDKYDTAVAACNPEKIYIEYSTSRDMNDKGFMTLPGYSSSVHFVEDEYKDILDDIQNKTIFDESELLAMINGDDAVTITPEVYQQLVKMFQSSDQDNHIMAMEIMANSNYIDSALYLLLLLLGGMVVPFDKLPEPVAAVAKCLPSGALADVLRDALVGQADRPATSWIVLGIWAVLTPLLAAKTFRWE